MSERTFLLSLSQEDKEYTNLNDVIDILTIRVAEAYLEANSENKIQTETLSSIKSFISSNLLVSEGNPVKYYVDIDFENDIK